MKQQGDAQLIVFLLLGGIFSSFFGGVLGFGYFRAYPALIAGLQYGRGAV